MWGILLQEVSLVRAEWPHCKPWTSQILNCVCCFMNFLIPASALVVTSSEKQKTRAGSHPAKSWEFYELLLCLNLVWGQTKAGESGIYSSKKPNLSIPSFLLNLYCSSLVKKVAAYSFLMYTEHRIQETCTSPWGFSTSHCDWKFSRPAKIRTLRDHLWISSTL